jgi:flagellar M-ring protein FliF
MQSQAQLSNLNTSEKMLIATLLAVIPMLFFGVAQYASKPEMVTLLDQPFTPDEQSRIASHLRTMGVRHELAGEFINVPAEERYGVIGSLGFSDLLPEDTSGGFKEMIENQTWWQSSAQTQQMYQMALQDRMQKIIKTYDWVRDAKVVISMPETKGFGAERVAPSASVSIQTRSGDLTQRHVDGLASLIAGAKAELMTNGVTVIDEQTGRAWKVRDNEMFGGDNQYLENQLKIEMHYRDKIMNSLAYIHSKIVAVNADVDPTWRKTEQRSYSKEDSVSQIVTEGTISTSSNSGASGGNPGVQPNVGVTIDGAGGGTESASDESEATYENETGYIHEVSANPGGHATRISATINIPRSFFVKQFRYGKPEDTPEPTDDALEPIITPYLAKIKAQIEPLVIAQDQPGKVVVDVYPDTIESVFVTEEQASLVGGVMARATPSTLGVGALSMVSLLFMMMLLRRASRKPISPSVRELAGIPETLESTDDDVIGDAAEYDEALDGVELDDETLRHRKLVEQMTEMIQESPGEVATLVKRWVQQDG